MTPQEAAALLAIAAAFDNRKPDADAATAWSVTLEGLRFQDCREAIVAHYRQHTEWIMPAHVRTGVRRLREKRIADYGPVQPPPELNPDDFRAYQRWVIDTTSAIADGELAPAQPLNVPSRDVIATLGHIGHEVPS